MYKALIEIFLLLLIFAVEGKRDDGWKHVLRTTAPIGLGVGANVDSHLATWLSEQQALAQDIAVVCLRARPQRWPDASETNVHPVWSVVVWFCGMFFWRADMVRTACGNLASALFEWHSKQMTPLL